LRPRLPSTAPLLQWVGAEYGEGRCWNLVRDALIRVGGLEVAEDYYEFAKRLTQVHDARDGGIFVPEPWDIVMLRTLPRAPLLIFHPGLCIDGKRFIHSWGSSHAVISEIDDPDWRRYIAGYVRIYQ
jgi:hypothetical protein